MVSSRLIRWVACLVISVWASSSMANAPAGRYVVDVANGTVLDSWTKLTWQRTPDAAKYKWSASGLPGSGQAYCTALTLSGGGWHLPSVTELRTLSDRQAGPAIDPVAFPNTPVGNFWTSTQLQGSTSYAWYIYSGDGSTGHGWSDYYANPVPYWVRCVR